MAHNLTNLNIPWTPPPRKIYFSGSAHVNIPVCDIVTTFIPSILKALHMKNKTSCEFELKVSIYTAFSSYCSNFDNVSWSSKFITHQQYISFKNQYQGFKYFPCLNLCIYFRKKIVKNEYESVGKKRCSTFLFTEFRVITRKKCVNRENAFVYKTFASYRDSNAFICAKVTRLIAKILCLLRKFCVIYC